jgi:hypothetical protein
MYLFDPGAPVTPRKHIAASSVAAHPVRQFNESGPRCAHPALVRFAINRNIHPCAAESGEKRPEASPFLVENTYVPNQATPDLIQSTHE